MATMNTRVVGLRPGGRSARVQAAVHQAVRDLTDQHGRAALTVPLIAARAGVTPSTVYRRWGDLADLLADVAVEHMRPETEPVDTGNMGSDLLTWAEQYFEEITSEVGLQMLRDVLSATPGVTPLTCQCASFNAAQIKVMVDRGVARGDAVPEVDAVMDGVVAPIVYRTLFGATPPTRDDVRRFVDRAMSCAKA